MSGKSKATRKSPGQTGDMIEVDHSDAVLRSFTLFIQTAQAVLKYADAHLYRKARFSVIKLVVLRALASNEGVARPYQLADWTQTEQNNITALIQRMKKEGLVEAERDSSDRRYVNVTLTDKGREVLSLVTPAGMEIADQVMSSIGEGNALQLEKLLKVLGQNVHAGLEHVAEQAPLRLD